MSLDKVNPSGKVVLKGSTFNELIQRVRLPGDQTFPGESIDPQPGIVEVHNGTKRDLLTGHCIGLGPARINSQSSPRKFLDVVVLTGATPEAGQHVGKFAVLIDDVPAGQTGRAVIRGRVWARVAKDLTGAAGGVTGAYAEIATDYATVERDRHLLVVGKSGSAQVLWAPTATSTDEVAWALIVIGNVSEQVVLADFRAHVSPATPYAYPKPSDGTNDMIFPAYLQRKHTYVDDPAHVDWDVDAFPQNPGGALDNSEPVFIHSLNRHYVPPRFITGRVIPVFQMNGKWWVEYVFRPRISAGVFATGSTIGPGDIRNFTGFSYVNYEYGGSGGTVGDYSPIKVNTTDGKFTAYRACSALVTMTVSISPYSYDSNNPIEGVVAFTSNGAFPKAGVLPHYSFPYIATGSGQAGTHPQIVTAHEIWDFAKDGWVWFKLSNNSGSISAAYMTITLQPMFGA